MNAKTLHFQLSLHLNSYFLEDFLVCSTFTISEILHPYDIQNVCLFGFIPYKIYLFVAFISNFKYRCEFLVLINRQKPLGLNMFIHHHQQHIFYHAVAIVCEITYLHSSMDKIAACYLNIENAFRNISIKCSMSLVYQF